MTFNTNYTAETEDIGRRLAAALEREGTKRAFIAMRGEMGVGKTALVRGFCNAIGIRGAKSPTYTIVNEYQGKHSVFHFDMYRIEDEDDLYAIGFEDYLNRNGYLFLEWSENVQGALPSPHITLCIERTDAESGRRITITGLEETLR